jgi:hypothetical protein
MAGAKLVKRLWNGNSAGRGATRNQMKNVVEDGELQIGTFRQPFNI